MTTRNQLALVPSVGADGRGRGTAAGDGASARVRQIVAEEIDRATARAPEREGMTADEVARFLGLDRKTVYDYANRGVIPHRKLGRRLLFSRSVLVAWLGSYETASSRRRKR